MGCLNWHSVLLSRVHNFCGNEAFMQLNHAFKNACSLSLLPVYMQLLICCMNAEILCSFTGVVRCIIYNREEQYVLRFASW